MQHKELEFSIKSLFVPFTILKAIHWIIFIGLVVFANMLFNRFVWDDFIYIIDNPVVHSVNVLSLIANNTFNSGGQYRPLTAIYFSLLYALFGQNAFFYHFIQLLLHILNAILLFLLFKHFFSKPTSLLLSLIFLIHPIQVESVSFIGSSDNVLFFTFGTLAFLLCMTDKLSIKRIFGVSVLLFLSYLSKETGVLFFVAISAYVMLFRRKNIIAIFSAGFLSIVTYGVIRLGIGNAETPRIGYATIYTVSFIQRLSNIPQVILYYLRIIFFPTALAIDQQWVIQKINVSTFYIPLLLDFFFFFAILLVGVYVRKSRNLLLIFLLFLAIFVSGFFLHLQIIPLDMTVADRWFYFPLVGLLGIVGVFCSHIKVGNKNIQRCLLIVSMLLLMVFSVITIMRNRDWSDNITLYSHDIKVLDNYQLESNLGYEYYFQGDYGKFLYHTKKSIQLLPNESNLSNLGTYYMTRGDMESAQKYFLKALTFHVYPTEGQKLIKKGIYESLAWIYVKSKQFQKAKSLVTSVISEYPSSDKLWADLAISEYNLKNNVDALDAASRAKVLNSSEQNNYLYNQIFNNKQIDIK